MTMMNFIHSNGGFVAAAIVVVALYNIVFSAIAQIFAAMKKAEPSSLQTAGEIGLKIAQWLSANTPTPTPAPAEETPTVIIVTPPKP